MANVTMYKENTFGLLLNNKPILSFLSAPVATVIEKLLVWQDRLNARDNLRDTDARLLQDMGISTEAANVEAAKPFWIN